MASTEFGTLALLPYEKVTEADLIVPTMYILQIFVNDFFSFVLKGWDYYMSSPPHYNYKYSYYLI